MSGRQLRELGERIGVTTNDEGGGGVCRRSTRTKNTN